ncbi:LPXTG cell wall anchor domain-containing protein [Vagococcus sp. JNUCC 83]
MKNNCNHFLICLMVVLTVAINHSVEVFGASTNAQVVVPSEISFYEGQQTTNDSSLVESGSNKKNNQSTVGDSVNKKGFLPQTGESERNYEFIGLTIVLVGLLLFFVRKIRNGDGNEI